MPSSRPAIPAITTEQMREVDRLAVAVYGMELIQMMENAGRSLAELSRRMLGHSALHRRVVVAAGHGNNGGGGLAAARHLANWGAAVTVLLESPQRLSGAPHRQWLALHRLPVDPRAGVAALDFLTAAQADLVLDALIGYGLAGSPRGWPAAVIDVINTRGIPTLALDVPSGLDATRGRAHIPCVKATATMTLALPKTGLLQPEARTFVGRLWLADIGVPPGLYRELGLEIGPLFDEESLIEVDRG